MLNEVDLERGTTVWIIKIGEKAVGTCRGLNLRWPSRSFAVDSQIIGRRIIAFCKWIFSSL